MPDDKCTFISKVQRPVLKSSSLYKKIYSCFTVRAQVGLRHLLALGFPSSVANGF